MLLLSLLVIGFTSSFGQEAPAGDIRGRVIDLFGAPIEGVTIVVSIGGNDVQRLVTDERGVYQTSKLSAGRYIVTANLKGFLRTKSDAYVGPGEHLIVDLGLPPGRISPALFQPEVVGIVRSTNRKPVVGATVTIISAFNSEIRVQAEADSSGRFKLQVPEPGQYVLYASMPGFAVAANVVTIPLIPPRKTPSVNFELRSLAR